MAKSKVTFPDGTEVEFPPDAPPEQIRAILSTLRGTIPTGTKSSSESQPGEVIEPQFSAEEIWEHGSKKDRLALFVRNHFLPDQWFSTIEVRDQQLEFVKRLVFGESPAIATYLNRLHEDGYLKKTKKTRRVNYQLTQQILDDFPTLGLDEITQLIQKEY